MPRPPAEVNDPMNARPALLPIIALPLFTVAAIFTADGSRQPAAVQTNAPNSPRAPLPGPESSPERAHSAYFAAGGSPAGRAEGSRESSSSRSMP